MLTDLHLQSDYRSGRDALLNDFYIPCLEEAIRYDRAVGFFSSSLLQVVGVAYSDFVQRDGRMRLICSPALSTDDFDAMKTATERSSRAQALVREELNVLLRHSDSVPATRLLASLVAAGVLDIKLAFLDNSTGIFHDKLGIFHDADTRRVSFVGSANETWAAWGLNHESFEVFCSWRGEAELLRTRRHEHQFERLWTGHERGVIVEPLDSVTRDRLVDVADRDLDRAMAMARTRPRRNASAAVDRQLLPHQESALRSWRENDCRGIVAFATGAGKTLVALRAVKEWTENGRPALILVPGRELHRQWLSEIAIEIPDAATLPCGAGSGPATWGPLLSGFTSPEGLSSSPRIVLATNATFATPEFHARMQAGEHLLLVADEMHRLGARRRLAVLLQTHTGGRMGLSATYRRQFDERGTRDLMGWFSGVLDPVIGIAEAILMGRLVPYDYIFHTLALDDDEFEKYELLTKRIKKAAATDIGRSEPSDYLKMLLINRARVMKQARGKVDKAIRILMAEYRPAQRWLVYCDDLQQMRCLLHEALIVGLPVMEFHSTMAGDRAAVLQSLALHGGIVVAIRCLDEGVDIPVCDHALILASSTVDREYIQRRGRVLRIADGKPSAVIHDLLLVDRDGGVLARSEALRALEFARLARNPGARANLQLRLALSPDIDIDQLPGVDYYDDEGMNGAEADDERDSGG